MTTEVSEKRLNDLLHEIDEWLKFQFVTRKLESMIGKLSFITNCVKAAHVFISRLINALRGMSGKNCFRLDAEAKKDLQWWKSFLPIYNSVSLLWLRDWQQVDELAASDASLSVVGGNIGNRYFYHPILKPFVNGILVLLTMKC